MHVKPDHVATRQGWYTHPDRRKVRRYRRREHRDGLANVCSWGMPDATQSIRRWLRGQIRWL